MNRNKIVAIVLIILIAFGFSLYQIKISNTYKVIGINNAGSVIIDLNKNGVEDNRENINLLPSNKYRVVSFYDINYAQKLSKHLNVDLDSILGVGYIADKFAEDSLKDNKVSMKIVNGSTHIYVDKVDYTDKLINSGYVFLNDKPVNPNSFKSEVANVSKIKLRIYNVKSHKFHRLSCKYGRLAHNLVVISQSQLPKDAIPCKFCLGKFKTHSHKEWKYKHKHKIPCPPLVFKTPLIKIFLSDYTNHLKPDRSCSTPLCQELVKQINNSQNTIDIAIYGYDRVPAIDNAIKAAINRGVKVRLVYDIDSKGNNIYSDTSYLVNIIKLSRSDVAPIDMKAQTKYTNSLMHDKFYIFDSKTLIAGSANLSSTDMSGFNENSTMLVNSQAVASVYQTEFDQMFSGRFHNLKTTISNNENIAVGDSILSIYFSPKDNIIKNTILPLIGNAQKYIYIPTFLITDKSVSDALIYAKKRGVCVKVIVDATNARAGYSKHQVLRNAGILVKTENYAGKMHSKSMIIDDTYVVIGSMNLSKSGNSKNDENIIVLKNSKAAIFYRKFFDYLWVRIYDFWAKHDVSSESIYSIGSCSDGVDNDYDGKIDLKDEGCKKLLKSGQKN